MQFLLTLILSLAILWPVKSQELLPDSVEAISIQFKVLPALDKHGLPKETTFGMQEVYYIMWDDFVIIKEVHVPEQPFYWLHDLKKQMFWACEVVEDQIMRYTPDPRQVQSDGITVLRDWQKRFLNVPVFKCQIVTGNGNDTLTAWQTDVFGVDFSTIGTLPGVPLYYEKYWQKDKLRFIAQSIDTVMVSRTFFVVDEMPVIRTQTGATLYDVRDLITDDALRNGSVFDRIEAKTVTNKRIEVPEENSPSVVFYFLLEDAATGIVEKVAQVMKGYDSAISCVAICDGDIQATNTYASMFPATCPLIANGTKFKERTGIMATAFLIIIDSGGFVDEIIYPQLPEWELSLKNAVQKVLRK